MTNDLGKPVLVTTEYRGVFFGYADGDTDGDTIKLKRARNCIYWPVNNQGVFGLASMGPQSGAKIGPAVDIELRKVTSVVDVTPAAAERWEKATWK